MGAQNEKFEGIPRHFGPCLYAVQLANGVVKIGCSLDPRSRMRHLSNQLKRRFGAEIERFHIGDLIVGHDRFFLERDLIARLSTRGEQLPGTAEFFMGLDIDCAVQEMRSVYADLCQPTQG